MRHPFKDTVTSPYKRRVERIHLTQKGHLPSPQDKRNANMKIITHAGKAHLDDLMTCAILIAHDKIWNIDDEWSIERREPTDAELDNEAITVLDVGGRYEPTNGNFDHHQLPRGSKDSTMTLLAANLGIPNGANFPDYVPGDAEFPVDSIASFLENVFPWFRRRAELDSCGPFATAKSVGVDWSVVESFLGPFEDMVLSEFEKDPVTVASKLADMITRKWEAFSKVLSARKVDRPQWGDGEFTIVDFTAADPADTEEVSDALTAKVNGVAIFHDNRGDGLTLLRLKDDPRIDFTKVKNDKEVIFAHAGGFIAKTKSKNLDEAWRLIESAYINK